MALLMGISLLLAQGCDFRAKQAGAEGELQFYYTPADSSRDFSRPLARGTGMMILVEGLGGNTVERILSVSVNDEEVLGARPSEQNPLGVMLQGRRQGVARLTLTVQGTDRTFTDHTEIRVSEVEELSLSHACTDQINAAYLPGEPIFLKMQRRNKERKVLVGSTRQCPVTIEPYQFEDIHCDESGLYLPAVNEVGAIRVRGNINNRAGTRDQLGIQLIGSETIDFLPVEQSLQEGFSTTVELDPVRYVPDGQIWPICADFRLYVSILTPETCLGPGDAIGFEVPSSARQKFNLHGIAPGDCYFDVRLPEFGNNIVWEFDTWVDPKP